MFKSLYPSIIAEFNIAPNTLIGRVEIDSKIYDNENLYNQEHYSRGGEFIENMVTDNTIEFSKRWFKLAGFKEFIDDMDEFYNSLNYGQYSKLESNPRNVILPSTGITSPVKFTGSKVITPVKFYTERPNITYDELMKPGE